MTDYERLRAFLDAIKTRFSEQEKIHPYESEDDETVRIVCIGEIVPFGETYAGIGTKNM